MSALRVLAARLRAVFADPRTDLDEEVRAHLQMQVDELVRGGMTPESARAEAIQRFGHVEQMKNRYRDLRGLPSLEAVVRDLRYSARVLWRSPGFTTMAFLTLAIGIGATTAVFSLVNRAVLRPLPVERPHELVAVSSETGRSMFTTLSYPNYVDLRDRTKGFSGFIAYRFAPIGVSMRGVNERRWGYLVSGNYFAVLGVRPIIGRAISGEDDAQRDAHPVTVISYRFWQQRFGGDASAVGQSIIVNGRAYTIIGVAPRGFFGTEVIAAPDLWFPLGMQAAIDSGVRMLDDRGVSNLFALGRLAPGVSRAQVATELSAIGAALEREFPDVNEGRRIVASPAGLMGTMMRGPLFGFTALLLSIAGLVLLLACVNLANLLLARGIDRRHEVAIRLSIGAGRGALVRQLLVESLMVSSIAGVAGLLLAWWLMGLATTIRPPVDIPLVLDLPLDARVLLFNVVLSFATAIMFGLIPALQATKADLAGVLKDSASLSERQSVAWRNALIVVQVAVSLVLLTGAGLMWRALGESRNMALGYSTAGAFEVSFDLRLQGYSPEQGREIQRQLLDAVRSLPGITHAALADVVPIDLHFSRTRVFTAEAIADREVRAPSAFTSRITPGYFQMMRTRLEEGRDFSELDDRNSAPVAIVNRALARRLWPNGTALGRRVRLGSAESVPNGPALGMAAGAQRAGMVEIVGIVSNGKYAGFNENDAGAIYRPLRQSYSGQTSVVARTDGDVAAAMAGVRQAVHALDPTMPIAEARSFEQRLSLPLLPARVAAVALGSFGLLALVLATIGLYGIMSYAVSSRTHEIGVRLALGAQRTDVLRLVLSHGTRLVAVGIVAGVALAALGTRFMRVILFGISPTDPITYTAVVVMLCAVAMLACWIPARRALDTDPVDALRST